MHSDPQTLLVGVDGSPAGDGAIREAVAEARQLGASLRLVHVVPYGHLLTPLAPHISADLSAEGAHLLARTAANVASQAPDIEVSAQLRRGGVGPQLADAGAAAAAVFLGRDDRPTRRATHGHAAAGTVAQASCAVVSVPSDWAPHPPRGAVVVALKTTSCAVELLADAFAEAHTRGDRVVVLHAWQLPDGYDDLLVSRFGSAGPTASVSALLELLLREWRLSYPGVEVELQVVHDDPVRALVAASRSADLLVLDRPGLGLRIGGTARTVLRLARCPVRVVAPDDVRSVPGGVLVQGVR